MRAPDVLDVSAREHRELHRAVRALFTPDRDIDDLDRAAALLSSVARHEAMDRLLLYPLVGRDSFGRRSLVDRRAEQRSISDQLAKAIRTLEADRRQDLSGVIRGLHRTFVGHSDREEIEDFPHARRLSSVDERTELAELRSSLRVLLLERLPRVPAAHRHTHADSEHLGPVQIAIVNAKQILVELDRSMTLA